MNVENRHTIVPGGWTHEQDNTKTVRRADGSTERTIAREFGFNDYRRDTDVDFAPAYAYWNATRGYWARVRARWDRALAHPSGLRMKTQVDGMAMIVPLFTQAGTVQQGGRVEDAEIDQVFDEWVVPADTQPPGDGGDGGD